MTHVPPKGGSVKKWRGKTTKTYRPKSWHAAHNITLLIYHLQLTIKYRLPLINDMLSGLVKATILYAAFLHGIKIGRIGTDRNHAHIFMQLPPTMSISQAAQYLKGISSRITRINMPCLRVIMPGVFWSGGYWCVTVGDSWEKVDKYIKEQGIDA